MSYKSEVIDLGHYEHTNKEGKTVKYKIQPISPDLKDETVEHMAKYFVQREPITSYDKLAEDPVSLESLKNLWRDAADSGVALVAVLDDDNPRPTVIGVNMTTISTKSDDKEHKGNQGEKFDKVLRVVEYCTHEGNLYERYGVDKYMSAFGLSVDPGYHGLAVGYNLLRAREKMCKVAGLTMTATVFTAANSQYLAKKAGFEDVVEFDYSTFALDGKIQYPTLPGKMKLMALKYNH